MKKGPEKERQKRKKLYEHIGLKETERGGDDIMMISGQERNKKEKGRKKRHDPWVADNV